MAWQDNVVIANGIRQEVGGLAGVRQLDHLLRSAQVCFGLVPNQFALFNKMARKVARYLEDRYRSLLHIPSDANADARFEVGVELIALYHIKRYGAMGKQHLARLRVDTGRIGLEAADTK